MANLQRLLTRRPHIDEAEVEDVRERTMARLAALNDGGVTTEATEAGVPTATSDAAAGTVADTTSGSGSSDSAAGVSSSSAQPQATPPAPPKPAGPKIIVPRTISLGPPPEAPAVDPALPEPPAAVPEAHRTPSIIVLGAPESSASATQADAAIEAAAPADSAAAVDAQANLDEIAPTEAVTVEPVTIQATVEPVPAVEAEVAEVAVEAEAAAAVVETVVEAEPAAIAIPGDVPADTAEAPVADAVIDEAIAAEAVVAEPVDAIAVIPSTEAVPPRASAAAPLARASKPAVKKAPKPKATKAKLEPAKPAPAKAARAKAPATASTSTSTSKSTATKPPAAAKPARRPATAVPVIAEPEPVIDHAQDEASPWPGQWLKDVSPDAVATEEPAVDERPTIVRRDPAMPVDRVEVVSDDWDPDLAAAAVPVAVAAGVAVAEVEAPAAITEVAVVAPRTDTAEEAVPAEAASRAEADPILSATTVAAPVAAEPVRAKATMSAPDRTGSGRTRPAQAGPVPAGRRPAAKPPTKVTVARPPVQATTTPAVAAFCPYCALALEPPPTASRRCTRCKQRIVVKRVQGRVVYLTEAAVEVFESERIRSTNFGRWSKERAQWLRLAKSVHADPGRIDRLGAAPLSDKVVASAKTLYTSTTERQYRDAKRDDQWEDASRLKREQAAAMHRIEGSPASPTEEVLAMYREAVSTELRGIGKMAKEAALVGSDCCEACRADDGRTFKIAAELRTPRLPHDGCPKGLCRCHWDLTLRDRDMVQRYLRRTVRAPKAKRPSA